ncbi:MAG TPA: hypothetical protein VMO00_01350, partial [Methylomirabilota bacterium]|nr:hypothetical protein [Methylomirabilota bacterium]
SKPHNTLKITYRIPLGRFLGLPVAAVYPFTWVPNCCGVVFSLRRFPCTSLTVLGWNEAMAENKKGS